MYMPLLLCFTPNKFSQLIQLSSILHKQSVPPPKILKTGKYESFFYQDIIKTRLLNLKSATFEHISTHAQDAHCLKQI